MVSRENNETALTAGEAFLPKGEKAVAAPTTRARIAVADFRFLCVVFWRLIGSMNIKRNNLAGP